MDSDIVIANQPIVIDNVRLYIIIYDLIFNLTDMLN